MRVKIGDRLERRIERVYQLDGYSRKGDLIREATRDLVEELEDAYLTGEAPIQEAFDHSIDRGGVGGARIRLTPASESPVRFEYIYDGNPPHTTILDTGLTFIPERTPEGGDAPGIRDTLESLDIVERADVLTEGVITVTLSQDAVAPFAASNGEASIVDRVYDALAELIEGANRRVREGEDTRQAARRRAIKDYATSSHPTESASR